jgi:hypothetical protein
MPPGYFFFTGNLLSLCAMHCATLSFPEPEGRAVIATVGAPLVGAHDAAADTPATGGHKGRPYDIAIPFPRRVFRVRAVKSVLFHSAPDECGAFSLLPFTTETKGSGTPPGVG